MSYTLYTQPYTQIYLYSKHKSSYQQQSCQRCVEVYEKAILFLLSISCFSDIYILPKKNVYLIAIILWNLHTKLQRDFNDAQIKFAPLYSFFYRFISSNINNTASDSSYYLSKSINTSNVSRSLARSLACPLTLHRVEIPSLSVKYFLLAKHFIN